ncbi:DUF559 domain-containing protein [Agrococcus sp. HG114]|uniref:DUF559 domain-containing protein n=1 Tax=Agrococcus sp. HG114 TaxID=2969757 RepID=UPI00215A608B|nr:DUF559 domain-containing protein [Agrococcus sp. HG114]MCR8670271.1 DUF559 domain-containing protein [Agrococcus sp. HG114]
MTDPLAREVGVVTARQLSASLTKWQLERAVATGALGRVRPGWFALRTGAEPHAVAAVQAGGCVSCFSALRLHGVWVPEGKGRHTRLPEHRRSRGSRACRPFGQDPPVRSAVDDLETAFRCALRCGSREDLVVVVDAILHRRLATIEELHLWVSGAPAKVRALLALADARSESGSESMVRLRLRSRRLSVRIQVRVVRGVRVDLLVGDRLIIECDSREHHTDSDAYEDDRRRDRRLLARGFIVMRLTYRQIHDEWPEIEAAILQIVRRGDHRWPRRRKPSDSWRPEEVRLGVAMTG